LAYNESTEVEVETTEDDDDIGEDDQDEDDDKDEETETNDFVFKGWNKDSNSSEETSSSQSSEKVLKDLTCMISELTYRGQISIKFGTNINVTEPLLEVVNDFEKNMLFTLNIMDGRDEEEGFDNSQLAFESEFVSFEGDELLI
jgi:hypothetical protein